MNFRNDIQGLRAVAVLLVFVFHLDSKYLSGGFIGVDIFFVISGFLISSIILHKKETDSFKFLDFYIGRIKRIVPAYLFFLLIIFMVGCFVYLPMDILRLRDNIFHAVIFNSNNYLASLDTYFGAKSSENPILHTWTLAIEMQFYFLLPVLLIAVKRKYITPIVICLILIFLCYSYINSTFLNNKNGMYFSLLARIPEFLIGTLIAVNRKFLFVNKFKLKNLFTLISIVVIIGTALILDDKSNFPGLLVVFPCFAVAFILSNEDSFLNRNILSNKILVHIGELSYSIYLWHWASMAFTRYYNFRYNFTIFESILLSIFIYLISYLSYKYVESYFRNLGIKQFIIKISVPIIVLGIYALMIPKINNKIFYFPNKYIKASFGLATHAENFNHIQKYGELNKRTDSILLLGDSHGLVYVHLLDQIGKRNGFNFRALTMNSIPTIPGVNRKDFDNEIVFDQYQKLIDASADEIKSSKVILISSVWNQQSKSLPLALDNLAKNLRKNQKIVILSDFPTLDKNPIRYNRSIVKKHDKSNFDYNLKIKAVPENINIVINQYPNIYKLDDIDYSSYRSEIPFYKDTIMYYDDGHLNIYGTTYFSKKIEKDFMRQFNVIKSKD